MQGWPLANWHYSSALSDWWNCWSPFRSHQEAIWMKCFLVTLGSKALSTCLWDALLDLLCWQWYNGNFKAGLECIWSFCYNAMTSVWIFFSTMSFSQSHCSMIADAGKAKLWICKTPEETIFFNYSDTNI